ncbi:MAG TPA: tetratricopeptide repeat protein [Planctomycetota bacterium]|nr:tetratricopeptide repeat protein [Planctomycetota bacterium]
MTLTGTTTLRALALAALTVSLALSAPGCEIGRRDKSAGTPDPVGSASTPVSTKTPTAGSAPVPTPAQAPSSTLTPTRASTEPLPKECDETLAAVRKYLEELPKNLSGMKDADSDRLASETERLLLLCQNFDAGCSSHPRRGELDHWHARLLSLMTERVRVKLVQECKPLPNPLECVQGKMASYMEVVERLQRRALERLPADDPLRPRALQLAGQACAEARRPADAGAVYESFLETYPEDPEVDKVTLALGRALLEMEKHDEGIRVIKAGIDKFYTSDSYAYFGEVLWQLYVAKGDLDGMLECTRRVETVYPLRLTNSSLRASERETFEQFIDFNGFRKGYTHFARGELEKAREAFQAHIAAISSKESSVGKLKPPSAIYRQRSESMLQFLQDLAGLPIPQDFDLGEHWVTAKQVRGADARGKVLAVVFRGVGDERSAAFAGPLSQICAKTPDMEFLTIHYLRGGENIQQQADELRADLFRAGIEGAAGFDPDAAEKKLFRAFQANVGSATFFIVNRRGELVWFMPDPRPLDVRFAEVLLRQTAS